MVSTRVRTSTTTLFFGLKWFRAHSPPHVIVKSLVDVFGLIVRWSIDKLNIPLMQDTLITSISTFHTTGIIILDSSKFSFIGSIPKAMFRDVPTSSKILEGYRKLTPSGPHELSEEMQVIIAEADKPKKGGGGRFKEGRKENHK